jgi:hypothetical protein
LQQLLLLLDTTLVCQHWHLVAQLLLLCSWHSCTCCFICRRSLVISMGTGTGMLQNSTSAAPSLILDLLLLDLDTAGKLLPLLLLGSVHERTQVVCW